MRTAFLSSCLMILMADPASALDSPDLSRQISELKAEVGALKEQVGNMNQTLDELTSILRRSAQRKQVLNNVSFDPDGSEADDFALGDPKAPVLIMEFIDFQCGFCARFAKTVFLDIKRDYIDTGKVRYVFRDFPLSMHRGAPRAASYAACAAEQGKFMQMHEALFEHPDEVASADFTTILEDLNGIDSKKLSECLTLPKYSLQTNSALSQEVQEDMQQAQKLGVSATPSFFIGRNKPAAEELRGVLLRGGQSFESFKDLINDYLD